MPSVIDGVIKRVKTRHAASQGDSLNRRGLQTCCSRKKSVEFMTQLLFHICMFSRTFPGGSFLHLWLFDCKLHPIIAFFVKILWRPCETSFTVGYATLTLLKSGQIKFFYAEQVVKAREGNFWLNWALRRTFKKVVINIIIALYSQSILCVLKTSVVTVIIKHVFSSLSHL